MAEQVDAAGKDIRTNQTVLTQYRKLCELKRHMVRDGVLNGDAKMADVLAAVRSLVPPNLI